MPVYGQSAQDLINASAQQCYDALSDFERVPEWQAVVKRCTVLERDERGRGLLVAYEVDVKLRTVRYRLRQIHDEPHSLGSTYAGGDFRDMSGGWTLEQQADGRTLARLELAIDPGRFVPGPIRALIAEVVLRRAVADLKARFAAA